MISGTRSDKRTCSATVAQRWRSPVAMCLLVGLIAWTAAGGAIPTALRAINSVAAPVYTVADLQRQVARNPRTWTGQTVRVQGVVWADHERFDAESSERLIYLADADALVAAGAPPWGARLPLARGPADHLLALLRRLPLIRRVMPPPQDLHWGALAVYRVQLHTFSGTSCPTCVEALLLDGDPRDTLLPVP